MAKYDWNAIEIAYKKGIEIEVIARKYGVIKKTLQNKIYSLKWEVNTPDLGNINHDIKVLGQSLGNLNGHTLDDPILEEIVLKKIDTMFEDNGLIENNRKLAKLAQGIIVKHKDKFDHTNIKNLTGAIKDIESIANPQATKMEMTQQTIQTVAEVRISDA